MEVVIAGGHGKVALRLERLLAARGDHTRGLIRNPEQAANLERAGAEPVVFDLEANDAGALADHVEDADAVVFAAGAGPGSGPARKRTVDLDAALKLIEACAKAGVHRYLMVSAIAVDRPRPEDDPMRPYAEAKREADEALRASGLDYTIVRPGRLTDDPGVGTVAVGTPLDRYGEIPRDDVAATLVACLDEPATAGLTFDLVAGDTPIAEAIPALATPDE